MAFSELVPDESCEPVSVHPLVVLSISDHVTRMDYVAFQRAAHGEEDENGSHGRTHPLAPVLGILFGEHQRSNSGTGIDVVASLELVLRGATDELSSLPRPPAKRPHSQGEEEEEMSTAWSPMQEERQWYVDRVDWHSVSQACQQMCRVHPEMRVVGWYTVGSEMGDLAVCAQLNAHVAAIVQQDKESRKNQAEAHKSKGTPALGTGIARVPTSSYPGGAVEGPSASDNAAAEETAETDLLALVVDARMSDAHAKLPVHVFTVRMNDAAILSLSTSSQLLPSTATDTAPGSTAPSTALHLERLPMGMTVAEQCTSTTSQAHVKSTTFLMTRFRIESDEIEHIGVDGAMSVDLQSRRVNLSDEELAARGTTAFSARHTGEALSQSELARVRQALQTPAELSPSIARFRQALRMLRRRVQLLVLYLESVEKGGVQSSVEDDLMLRKVATLVQKLPCTPPSYPHAHWNSIHSERARCEQAGDVSVATRASATASAIEKRPSPSPAPPLLPRPVHGAQTVNAVVGEKERTLLAALLTAQTSIALDARPLQLAQASLTRQMYQSTADLKACLIAEAREAQARRFTEPAFFDARAPTSMNQSKAKRTLSTMPKHT